MLITTKNNFDWTNVKPGDILTCTASANPEPSYVWWKVSGSGNDIVWLNGPILKVTTSMQGRYRFACKATNIVNKEIKTAGIDIDFIVVGKYTSFTEYDKYIFLKTLLMTCQVFVTFEAHITVRPLLGHTQLNCDYSNQSVRVVVIDGRCKRPSVKRAKTIYTCIM